MTISEHEWLIPLLTERGVASQPPPAPHQGPISHLFTYWLAEQRSPVLAVGLISFESFPYSFRKTRTISDGRALDSHLCRTWLAGTASRPLAAPDAGWTPVAVALGPPVEEASTTLHHK